MSYQISLTDEDCNAIAFSGGRYCWSDALISEGLCEPRTYAIPEHTAWELCEAFERDAEGGHSMFPLLDPMSELARKLHRLCQEVV